MKKLAVSLLVGLVALGAVAASTVTNQLGQVVTVTLMSDVSAAGTQVTDMSRVPIMPERRGLLVAQCKITSSTSGTVDISLTDLPKGAILLEDAVIEVNTAVEPATSTNSLAIGGVTVLATGVTLNSTGIKQAVATPGITTSADKLALTVTGDAATNGNFTVFVPYILGNAQ